MRSDSDIKHIWVTSDLHFLHPKIVGFCKRPISIKDHDEWLLDRINACVNKKDELYILGDVSMASRIETEKILQRMNGIKHLIPGNHDNNLLSSTYFKCIHPLIYDFNFNSESYPNIHIVMCHYPIASWNRKVQGSMHLHGHTHNGFQNRGLSFDIGVDANNYLPLNLEQIFDKFTEISLKLM